MFIIDLTLNSATYSLLHIGTCVNSRATLRKIPHFNVFCLCDWHIGSQTKPGHLCWPYWLHTDGIATHAIDWIGLRRNQHGGWCCNRSSLCGCIRMWTKLSFPCECADASKPTELARVVGKASSSKYSISAEAACAWHAKQRRASFGLGGQTATHARKSRRVNTVMPRGFERSLTARVGISQMTWMILFTQLLCGDGFQSIFSAKCTR